ncbi:MAG: carbonic anhydrase family protein [Coleofasciculus sp. G3-WIS-01]|uniref:carbonic anhydrase n=1 Tax=Coleofasciculus sp. G3-WIS-01 TaxID=3069528 RepID=UPI0032FBB935
MDRRKLLKYLSIGVAGTSLTAAVQSLVSASGGGGAAWGYTGSLGPSNWGSLDPAYAVCGTGTRQSPIALTNPIGVDFEDDFTINYNSFSPTIRDTGKTIQVDCPPGSTLTLDGKTFNLIQFHFHAPSEHTIDNQVTEMEVHLVHQRTDANGNVELAVIGRLMEVGSSGTNSEMAKILNNLPASGGTTSPSVTINPKKFLPQDGLIGSLLPLLATPPKYYRYSGSLTTPPCSEIVNWLVYKDTMRITSGQFANFTNLYSNNSRPVQERNGRLVLKD